MTPPDPIKSGLRGHIIAAAVGAVVAASGALGYHSLATPQRVITFAGEPRVTAKATINRVDRYSLGSLEQSEIDAITSGLNKESAGEVLILCQNDSVCGDMALDFDNAFESAHWKSDVQRPLFDDTVGLASNNDALIRVVNLALHGRLVVNKLPPRKTMLPPSCAKSDKGLVECKMTPDPIMLVLGKKPK